MTSDPERTDSPANDESALPLKRQDLQEGLRAANETLAAAQDEAVKATAMARALASLLVQKGILRPEEVGLLMRRVRMELLKEPMPRVRMGNTRDKYTAAGGVDIDCASRMPLCQARCCTFAFTLTKQDLDEGVVRWDYGNPYWIKQRPDGYCTHCDPETQHCTIHAQRPFVCRKFDCRDDKRIWLDFDARIPAPAVPSSGDDPVGMAELLLHKEESNDQSNRMDLNDIL